MKLASLRSQRGWTLIELLICIALIGVLVVVGTVCYVAYHFITKFW